MTAIDPDEPETLAGLEPPSPQHGQPGSLEVAVGRQVSKLRDLGYIEDHHSALVELARVTARDIDRSYGRGAPSGRANLLRVMNEVLESLPQPEAASSDQVGDVVAAMRAAAEAEAAAAEGRDALT